MVKMNSIYPLRYHLDYSSWWRAWLRHDTQQLPEVMVKQQADALALCPELDGER